MYRNKHNYNGVGISVNMVMSNITYLILKFLSGKKAQYDQQTVITKGFIAKYYFGTTKVY